MCGVFAVEVDVCFFFKQKTAYELRISDWSSDVCSSDLIHPAQVIGDLHQRHGNGLELTGQFDRRVLRRQRLEIVIRGDEFQAGPRGQSTCKTFAEARIGIDAGADRGAAKCELQQTRLRRIEPFGSSEEHTSELQSLMRISYAVFCL